MPIINDAYLTTLMEGIKAGQDRRKKLQDMAANSVTGPTTGPGGLGGAQALTQGPVGGSVGGWIQQAAKAMGRNFSPQEVAALQLMIQKESGGNPNAINRWDSNARAGHPSQGLMQTIPSTFKAYALPGYNTNITDPISNIIAGVRYAQARYGGLLNTPGVRAVNSGGGYRGY